jgi:hypothetical protein
MSALDAMRKAMAILKQEPVAYNDFEDSVGHFVCCGEPSYRPHAPGCGLIEARDLLQAEITRLEKPAKVSAHFEAFWAAYPRKVDKAGCLRKWTANGLDKVGEQIIAHVKAKATTHDWQKDGCRFVPMPATYLNQRRWEEQIGTAVDDGWWQRAGFQSRYDAENAGCMPHNAHRFAGGRRAEAA